LRFAASMRMASQTAVRLHRSGFELDLYPRIGGAIAGFRHHGWEVLRPAPRAFVSDGDMLVASCFPLVPFSNRIADARFAFQGRVYRLEPNLPPEPHAIHGFGWQSPWAVAAADAGRAELTFRHAVAGTPLDYAARQTFTLDQNGLELALELTNAGLGPMPAGIGQHPYFIRTDGVVLRTRLDHVWLPDERKIPARRVSLPAAWDFAQGQRLAPLDLDHCFGGWDGRAELHWPEKDLTVVIEATPPLRHLVIYVPPGQDFFCLEPVSHVNDGFNLLERGVEDTGVHVLAPGQTLAGTIRFRVA
jgi:aldose 1-epimerase